MVTVNPLAVSLLPYDPILDLVPIAPRAPAPSSVIAVTDSLPARIAEGSGRARAVEARRLVLERRSEPSVLRLCRHPEAASARHRCMSPIATWAAPAVRPQRRTPSCVGDLVAGASGPVAAGKARILAVTGPQREPLLPDVPTVAEAAFRRWKSRAFPHCSAGADMLQSCATALPPTCRRLQRDPGFLDVALEASRPTRSRRARRPVRCGDRPATHPHPADHAPHRSSRVR